MEAIPDEVMFIKPYMMRAEEMKVADPIVSYYTLRYALQSALEYHKQNPTNEKVKQYLINTMGIMEERRKLLGEVTEPQAYFEKFVTILFVSADNDDRTDGSTKLTAQKFLILSYFIEAMNVFGELPPDWVEKRKYCKWKAADILKAIKKGERPLPGGPNEREGAQLPPPVEERKQESMKGPEGNFNPIPPPRSQPEPSFKPEPAFKQEPPVFKPEPAFKPDPPPSNQSKYIPPPSIEKKAPVLPIPTIEVPERKPGGSRTVISKELRAAMDQAKKFALNGVQELEYKNIQQARIAFENAIRSLDAFNNT